MSTYTELKGLKVKYLASDPDPEAAGDVWYNSTTSVLKTFVGRAAWSAGSPLSTARNIGAFFGTQTAAVSVGGNASTFSQQTEEYNGSGWSVGENIPAVRGFSAGGGTLTAGLIFGGHSPNTTTFNTTFEYDGTDWTAGGNINTARFSLAGAGTQTAGLAFGGNPGSKNESEEYNGTAWTEGQLL